MINKDFGISHSKTKRAKRTGGKRHVQGGDLPRDGVGSSVEQPEPNMKAAKSGKSRRSKRSRRNRNRNRHRQNEQAQRHASGRGSMQGSIAVNSLKHPDGSWDLDELAASSLRKYGLDTGHPPDVKAQMADIIAQVRPTPDAYVHPPAADKPWVRDLRHVPFVSVDNGTLWSEMDPDKLGKDPEANVSSKDIDQLQSAVRLPNGDIRVTIAVSDVSAFIEKDSPMDKHMDVNTGSVYTPDEVFNLVPREGAEDVFSLNPREERLATIAEYTITPDGVIKDEEMFQAIVKSRTKLDYASVGGWLEGDSEPSPAMLAQGPELQENLKIQAEASARLEKAEDRKGGLEFDTTETRIITEDGKAVGMEVSKQNVATEMVANFMKTFNGVQSRFARSEGYATLERVVEPPEKWDRIRSLAKEYGHNLPAKPSTKALADFMAAEKAKNPEKSGELSISVIKLIGRGEYRFIPAGEESPGHFPLGVKNYMQGTASIRRGGDRMAARIVKAAMAKKYLREHRDELSPAQIEALEADAKPPYTQSEGDRFAQNLNDKGHSIKKAERLSNKKVTATMLEDRVGEVFPGVVTGIDKRSGRKFCRITDPPVDGSLRSKGRVEVGDRMKVKLKKVNPAKGWIDFEQQ